MIELPDDNREARNDPAPLGVAGHEGSTVIVGLNGLRLLRRTGRRTGAATT